LKRKGRRLSPIGAPIRPDLTPRADLNSAAFPHKIVARRRAAPWIRRGRRCIVGPMRVLLVVAAVAAVAAGACSASAGPADGPPPQRAFYYWRTTFRLSPVERRALAELGVSRLYVRAFDVEWSQLDGAPSLIGKLAPVDGERVPAGIDVVPVVFLRDEVLRHVIVERASSPAGSPDARSVAIPALARDVWAEVQRRMKLLGAAPRELQLDCDWTDTTRDAYFALIAQLRGDANLPLGATIRLHQVKYRERTGVPPVDRGMLMFYNMGRFSIDPEARAIFDPAAAARYLARVSEYPLPLDVALPIWSWTVHLRDDRVVGLLQSTDPDELAAVPFLSRAAPDRYVATRSAFLHGTMIREDDVLKIEVTGPAEALAAADQIAPHLARRTDRTVSLFDLSERNLARHAPATLDQVYRAVR
jgi:hypothetical protein